MDTGAGSHVWAVWAFATSGLDLDGHELPTLPEGVDACLDRLVEGADIVERFGSLAGPGKPVPAGLTAVEFRDAHVCLLVRRLRHDAGRSLGRTRVATALKQLTRRRMRERGLQQAPWWEVWNIGAVSALIANAERRFQAGPTLDAPAIESALSSVAEMAITPQARAALAAAADVPFDRVERPEPHDAQSIFATASRMRPGDSRLDGFRDSSDAGRSGPTRAYKVSLPADSPPALIHRSVELLIEAAAEMGAEARIDLVVIGSLEIHFSVMHGELTDDQARELARAIEAKLGDMDLPGPVNVAALPHRFRNYFVDSLTIETTSGAGLQVEHLPASTLLDELASWAEIESMRAPRPRASRYVSGYSRGAFGVSQMGSDGERRLGENVSLHEAGVRPGDRLRVSDTPSLTTNTLLLDRYAVVAPLTRSSAAVDLYRARDQRLGREVIVKVLRRQHRGPSVQAMFQAEPHHLTHIQAISPRVVTVFDVGQDELARAFYVMELLDARAGWHLVHTWVVETGPFATDSEPYVRFARLLRDTLDDFARAEVMHRDLKPGNLFVLLNAEGLPDGLKVIDLGLAARARDAETHRSLQVGTPGFMAPEQILGTLQTPEVDIWSAAAVLGFVVSGEMPFPEEACDRLTALLSSPFPASLTERESVAKSFGPADLKAPVRRKLARIAAELDSMLAPIPGNRRAAFDRLVGQLTPPSTLREDPMPVDSFGPSTPAPHPLTTDSGDLWATLARIYPNEARATDLVERAGIPLHRLPPFGPTPGVWWRTVKRELAQGVVAHADPVGRLAAEALSDHPGEASFRQVSAPVSPTVPEDLGTQPPRGPSRSKSFRRALPDRLAQLYDVRDDMKRVAEDAGLPVNRIDFSGAPDTVWYRVLKEADKRPGGLEALLTVVRDDGYTI